MCLPDHYFVHPYGNRGNSKINYIKALVHAYKYVTVKKAKCGKEKAGFIEFQV